MKITEIEPIAIAEPGGRRYIVLKVSTDEGLAGYGEAPSAPDPHAAVDLLRRELALVRGRDPVRAMRIDQELLHAGASAGARAGLNVALFDILGKAVRSPLYETLGGPTRNKARAMAVVVGETTDELKKAVLEAKAAGHRAFSVPLHMPAGQERGRIFYTGVRDMMDALRGAAGEECDFVLDCAGQTTPGEALSIADRLENFHLLWLDEPVGDLSTMAQASIASQTATPLGSGRNFNHNSRFQNLLREQAIDVLRPDLALNGITAIRKAAALAETYYVAVAPYHRGGPISTAAGLHISASLANSFIQETPFSLNEADRRMRREIAGGWDEAPEDGFYKLLEGPGLGLEINDDALAAHTAAS